MAASEPGQPISRLFYVRDNITGLQFFVDTAAGVSGFPAPLLTASYNLLQRIFGLLAASQLTCKTYKKRGHEEDETGPSANLQLNVY